MEDLSLEQKTNHSFPLFPLTSAYLFLNRKQKLIQYKQNSFNKTYRNKRPKSRNFIAEFVIALMKYYLLLVGLVCSFGKIFSQAVDSLPVETIKRDLKVGLVLSGGGAKGLAHIGALKVLEEEGIRIDYIGGTSMGAMIGGLYAAGYSVAEIDSIYKATNFEEIIQDELPRRSKSFYVRENEQKYAISFPFQKLKFGIPVSLSKGQNTYDLFTRLLYDYRFTTDFNDLPIPFLCIATDIETGEQVVFNKGNLAQAIVASGSFPTIFSPMEIDGRYLLDGGIVNNYPVEEVRKKGVDIIIGVDVQTSLSQREELNSMPKIVMQIINFQMLNTIEEKRKATDIYIKPDIKGYNVISFNDASKIVENGKVAAEQYRGQFREIAKRQNHNTSQTKPNNKPVAEHKIANIGVQGIENYSRAYVLGKLRFKTNETISCEDFKEGFNRLNATQNFRSIMYHFEENHDNQGDNLIIKLKEDKLKTFIRFGLHYDQLYKSGLLVNLTHKKLFTRNDVISVDFVFGDNIRYNLDYYIDNGFYWSVGVRSKFFQVKPDIPANYLEYIPSLEGLESIHVNYYELLNQIYVQTLLEQKFLLGAGLEHQVIDMRSKTITVNGQKFNDIYKTSNFLSTYGYITLDTYDKKHFPKKGFYIDGKFKWIFDSSILGNSIKRYSMAYNSVAYTTTFFDKLSLNLGNEIGFELEKSNGVFNFLLGGYGNETTERFRHFYGYDFLNITGNSFIKSSIGLDYEVYRRNHLNFYANFANVGHNVFDRFDTWFVKPAYSGYAFGYGLETLIGPIELKYSWSPETRRNFWWFSVGFWF